MNFRFFRWTCLAFCLCSWTDQALGQAKIKLQVKPSTTSLSITLSDAPKSGLIVVWQSKSGLANDTLWTAVHAYPVTKGERAVLPIHPKHTERAFFKLSWQNIILSDRLVWIPPGAFRMGSPDNEEGRFNDEGPVHDSSVPHGFWMAQYEVTQQDYREFMDDNPSSTGYSPLLPVNRVTWYEAVEFCERLTVDARNKDKLPAGYVYRLPTEAEWEYTCRAGTTRAYSYGDSADPLSEYGWWAGNSGNQPEPVGKLKPNPWGLYDMHGNLFEWCVDAYVAYPGGSAFSTTGKMKVLRGGAYYCPSNILRSACRAEAQKPDYRWILAGFRVVLAPPLSQAED